MTLLCPVCETAFFEVDDWLFECRRCGFWRSSLTPGVGRGVDGLQALRQQNFNDLLDRLRNVVDLPSAKILEVGCGAGWFLDEARKRNLTTIAIEPDEVSAKIVRLRGHDVRVGLFPDALHGDEKFDLIIFNDVFEHLYDPVEATRICRRLLNDKGFLIINLPNSAGVGFRIARTMYRIGLSGFFERLWQRGFASPHLTYFSPANLKCLVEREGFCEVDSFRLTSLTLDGLWKRLRSSSGPLSTSIMYPFAAVSVPFLNMLPSDAHVGVFRNLSET